MSNPIITKPEHKQDDIGMTFCSACHVCNIVSPDGYSGVSDDGTCENCGDGPVLIGRFIVDGEFRKDTNAPT